MESIYNPILTAIFGRRRAVRILEMTLTLWLSSTIFPAIGTIPWPATSTILPVLMSSPENCRLQTDGQVMRRKQPGIMLIPGAEDTVNDGAKEPT